MREGDTNFNVDRYLRREDTLIAKACRKISPKMGDAYREGDIKPITDKIVALPMAAASLPILGVLSSLVKLDDGGPVFYEQERYNQHGDLFKVRKLRSMHQGSEPDVATSDLAAKWQPEDDPRVTGIGKIMRTLDVDEVPQIFQVLSGELALVGIRAIAPYARDYMRNKLSKEEYSRWWKVYQKDKPGFFSLNIGISPNRKNDVIRRHADFFYAKHASLGLDLYIIYRVGKRIFNKTTQKIIEFVNNRIPKGNISTEGR